ncbi:Severin [Cladobotryum mycophilum]|uniref:Severin n=1 Tax=Cladobotryum mycophilum TaxID=491253 RepID=A0ABR0SLW8_9HYPO
MAPREGLIHPKEYDIKDSNVELIGSDIDHRVKYNSASTEPAWSNGSIGDESGLYVWRIEDFQVIPWPKEKYGQFYDGDSYIVLNSVKVGKDGNERLIHDIFFWLGNHTSQDEAGTAAYKTVELDEFLHGTAIQHREIQEAPSDEFLILFPRISIRSGGKQSGFRHVDDEPKKEVLTLLRVFSNPTAGPGSRGVVVHEVEPNWRSLDDGDVFVLDTGSKIWVWQGQHCSPMEKAKAAQVVHDMTLAKHVEVEVLSQTEGRARRVIDLLGGEDSTPRNGLQKRRPVVSGTSLGASHTNRPRRLFRLSDASSQLSFELVREGQINSAHFDGNDVFIFDDAGKTIWVWEGRGASRAEKAQWLQVVQAYLRHLSNSGVDGDIYLTPVAKMLEGHESQAFFMAIET